MSYSQSREKAMANRLPGYKQGRVIEVVEGVGGHVAVEQSHSGAVHFFVNGSMNAAPKEIRRVGAKCWLRYMKTPSSGLWYATPREASL